MNRCFLPVIASILGIIAFNTQFYWVVFVALVPLFLFFIRENNIWKLFAGAAAFRLILSFGTVYFVIDPYLYGLSIIIFLGLPLSIHLLKKYAPVCALYFSLPFLWVFWDYLESQYTLLPMVISLFGNVLAESPFLGLARFGGVISLTLFVVLINAVITAVITKKRLGKRACILILAAVFLLTAGYAASKMLLQQNARDYLSKNRVINVALMSAPKVKDDFNSELLLINLSENIDLFIVPEGLYPDYLDNRQRAIGVYSEAARGLGVLLSAITARTESSIPRTEAGMAAEGLATGGENLYMSSILFSKDGEIKDIYNKVNRTITSEYWPFENWRPFYFNYYMKRYATANEKKRAIFDSRYKYEKGEPKLIKADDFSFASPICIEAHYPLYVKKLSILGADFISHNSNNDWIEGGIEQYLRLTNNLRKIEAVWLNNPILVNGINDFTGIVFPDGTSDLIGPAEEVIIFEGEVRF